MYISVSLPLLKRYWLKIRLLFIPNLALSRRLWIPVWILQLWYISEIVSAWWLCLCIKRIISRCKVRQNWVIWLLFPCLLCMITAESLEWILKNVELTVLIYQAILLRRLLLWEAFHFLVHQCTVTIKWGRLDVIVHHANLTVAEILLTFFLCSTI
jgi:hypothetical protein